ARDFQREPLQPRRSAVADALRERDEGLISLSRLRAYNVTDMSPEQINELRRRTESDPNDEIAHFSLGKALVEGGDAAEGAKALQRVIALNPNIAKAYQLLGDAHL